ncbi:MAG: hypothetical protein ACLQLG_19890 [Thermoguttaceae bacterium]
MTAVSTRRTLVSRCSLLAAACLLGAIVLGGCYGRQSAGPDGEASPSSEGAARPAADSSATAASLAPKDEVSAPRAAAAEAAASPGGRYTATAYLRVSREEPYVVFPAAAAAGADYAFYKRTQMELMKTRFVLAAALRKPDVERLPCLRQGPARRDPAGWLAGQLRIDSPGDAEIVRVSLSGDDAEAAAALVNAVVHAYLEEVAGTEMEKRTKQLDRLDRLLAEKEEELRSSRNLRNQLAEHVGTVETPAGSVGQQLALEEVLDARKDLSAARNDLRRAQAERRADDALLSNPTSTEVPDYELDALAQNDAVIGQVLTPLVAELKKKMLDDNPAVAEAAAGKLKAVQAQIVARRDELRRGQEARKRAAIEGEIARLQAQIFATGQLVADCQEALDRLGKAVVHARQTSIESEVVQDKIGLLEEVVRAVARQRERAKIELQAGPRVTLLQAAEIPEKAAARSL